MISRVNIAPCMLCQNDIRDWSPIIIMQYCEVCEANVYNMNEKCNLFFERLPRNIDILAAAETLRENKRTKLESAFPKIYGRIQKIYGSLSVPILTRNAVRHRYNKLLEFVALDKKSPSLNYGSYMCRLFEVTKCGCDIESFCTCSTEQRIPANALEYFNLRNDNYFILCACNNNHKLEFRNKTGEVSQ